MITPQMEYKCRSDELGAVAEERGGADNTEAARWMEKRGRCLRVQNNVKQRQSAVVFNNPFALCFFVAAAAVDAETIFCSPLVSEQARITRLQLQHWPLISGRQYSTAMSMQSLLLFEWQSSAES